MPFSTTGDGSGSWWGGQTAEKAYPKVLVNQMIKLMPRCAQNQNEHLKWVNYPAPCIHGPPISACPRSS